VKVKSLLTGNTLLNVSHIWFVVCICLSPAFAGQKGLDNLGESYTNSIGMTFVSIKPGSFMMGKGPGPLPTELSDKLSYPTIEELKSKFPNGDPDKFHITTAHVRNGDFDEKPQHKVNISRAFYMGAYEVTNEQYEKFDPSHRKRRGENGFSKADDEAAIFVSWHDAVNFCKWLTDKESLPYRLPSEAEWEYACRARTTTTFHTGRSLPESFHKNARRTSFTEESDIVPLTIGQTLPNPWGLYDMHGNVEEWCYDWYGPYVRHEQTDPVGYADGDFKVTRGGSHGTNLYYLRSANRQGTMPEDRTWLIGFRVVIGELSDTEPLPEHAPEYFQNNVRQKKPAKIKAPDMEKPYFKGPRRYVKIPEGSIGPIYSHHNHDPGIVECPNGDLIAVWYTCVEERGRELAVAASRLLYGAEKWQWASPFWNAPDRNDHCPAVWFDGKNTIYHFNGLGVAGKWEPLAIIMRKSKDNGATWSRARLIVPEHGFRQMVGEPVFSTQDGSIVFGADADHGSNIWMSRNEGKSWYNPGGHINGIHAGIVQLKDGRLMALGRNENINGWMPKSISDDMGKSWKATPGIFSPLTGGQRAALIRLEEGPLFFATFAKDIENFEPVPDGIRPPRHLSSIIGAVSFDEGKTWPVRRIISDCRTDHPVYTMDGAPVLMNANNGEPLGYLSVCQDTDGVINLISSWNHYAFNLAWLKEKTPQYLGLQTRGLPVKKHLDKLYDSENIPGEPEDNWHFIAQKQQFASLKKVDNTNVLALKSVTNATAKWSNERTGGPSGEFSRSPMSSADAHKGLTAEAAVKVEKTGGKRGFDFEVFLRGGTLTSNHYLITITDSAVYYWFDKQFIKIADGLDNSTSIHKYRLAIRPDTVVQIYRDNVLIGVQKADIQISWRTPARASFIQWGLDTSGETVSPTKATVACISCDTTGPKQPE